MNNMFNKSSVKTEKISTFNEKYELQKSIVIGMDGCDKPPIPEGFTKVESMWENLFVIQNEKGRNSLWLTEEDLNADSVHDFEAFCEEVGRLRYPNYSFYDKAFDELSKALLEQFESFQKYRGFYIPLFSRTLKAISV